MSRSVKLEIGINGAFITRRWERPENMLRLTRELGYHNHEFCADVIDPFFMGDKAFVLAMAREVRQQAQQYGVHITDIYTGVATHRFHGLSHSQPTPRRRMREWIIECMNICREMGADRIGGHWDAISVEVMEAPEGYERAFARICAELRELAVIARDKGLAAIYQEQMYIPSEVPWTLDQCAEFLLATNADHEGVPVYTTVDVGHAAGVHYGSSGADVDYLEWLRRFAAVSEIIHLQQTTPDASHHWPFTEEYNEKGHIEIEPILEAIEYSHRNYNREPLSAVLEPVEKSYLIAEIIPGSTKNETKLLDELKQTAEYLHQFVPEEGLVLQV